MLAAGRINRHPTFGEWLTPNLHWQENFNLKEWLRAWLAKASRH